MKTTLLKMAIFIVRRLKEFMLLGDYDPIQLYAAAVGIGCAAVLQIDPHYMESSARLTELSERLPQNVWMWLLLAQGLAQTLVFILSGKPSFFSHNSAAVIHWLHVCIGVQLFGVLMWSSLAILLSFHGASWAQVTFGSIAIGCFWACCRLASLICVEREYQGQKAAYLEAIRMRGESQVKLLTGNGAAAPGA